MNITMQAGEEIRIDVPDGEIAICIQAQDGGDVGVLAFRYGSVDHEISELIVGKPRESRIQRKRDNWVMGMPHNA